jgi:hypothetical protein
MAGRKLPKGYRSAVTASDTHAKITFTGPLFSANADETLRQNIRRMMQGIADEGSSTVKARSPRITGGFISGVEGRVKGVKGNPWALSAVVSAFPRPEDAQRVYPWKNKGARGYAGRSEAVYRGGKLEQRYRMFRAVTSQLRSARAVMAANLTKGLE